MSDSVVPYLFNGIFGLLGVLVGGGLQIWAQHRSAREQRSRQQIDFRRSKLDELFGIAEQVKNGLIATYSNALGRLKYGTKKFPTENNIAIPIERMEMLVTFYFPELEANFDQIKKIWERAGSGVARSITVESIAPHEIEEARTILGGCLPALHAAMEKFVQGMSKIARKTT